MSEAVVFVGAEMSLACVPQPNSSGTGLDGHLVSRAEHCLRKSGYLGLRSVSCESHGNVLVLRGRVSSYYLKQLAQELVRRIEGGGMIVNKLEVSAR